MSTAPITVQAYRASLLHFHADPAFSEDAYAWHQDGLLVIEDGRVKAAGDYDQLVGTLPAGLEPVDYRGRIITPGFIDTHLHYPQTRPRRPGCCPGSKPTPSRPSASSATRRMRARPPSSSSTS
jgi:hypothetical protein